jgi:hypothetical protein
MADNQDRVPREPARAGAGELFSELTTDALRYWEVRRIFYNLLLAAIVVAHFAAAWPHSRELVTFDGALGLFLLAVIANVAYSVVYAADVFIQFSGFRASRSAWRRVLMVVGFAFAAVLTHFVASGAFGGSGKLGTIGLQVTPVSGFGAAGTLCSGIANIPAGNARIRTCAVRSATKHRTMCAS